MSRDREGPEGGLSSAPARQHGSGRLMGTEPWVAPGGDAAEDGFKTCCDQANCEEHWGWLEARTKVSAVCQSKGKTGSRLSAMHLLKLPGCFLWGSLYQYCNF